MDYQIIYKQIIEQAKIENRIKHRGIYYENHHIIPKCLNGTNDENNLVLLTAKEHYLCHKLLTYIYKGNKKIGFAYHLMTFMNKRKYSLTSRDYAYARELCSFYSSGPLSEEHKNNISKGGKGKNKGKRHSIESKIKMSNAAKNRSPDTDETKYKKGNARRGKPHTKETIEKMKLSEHNISDEGRLKLSAANKGKHRSEETKERIRKTLLGKNNHKKQ